MDRAAAFSRYFKVRNEPWKDRGSRYKKLLFIFGIHVTVSFLCTVFEKTTVSGISSRLNSLQSRMYYTYILYNNVIDRYYVGYTKSLKSRLEDHRKGKSIRQYTKKQKGKWKLMYYEEYKTQREAIRREGEIKRKKSRGYIEKLINK